MRQADGTIQAINIPGASSTRVQKINNKGQIIGSVLQTGKPLAGFLLDGNGYTPISIPLAQETQVADINESGTIVGWFTDNTSHYHGFVMSVDGTVDIIDVPQSSTTFVAGINNIGAIAGNFLDERAYEHGYIRASDGSFTTFEYPNAAVGTFVSGINDRGEVTGEVLDVRGSIPYIRSPEGVMKAIGPLDTFDGAAFSINREGAVVGMFDEGRLSFIYESSGTASEIRFDGTTQIFVRSINNSGWVSGGFVDLAGQWHGFILER